MVPPLPFEKFPPVMSHSSDSSSTQSARDPGARVAVRRARLAVGCVLAGALVFVILGSVLPGRLGRVEAGIWGLDPDRAFRLSQSVVLGLAVLSVAVRRALGNRASLRDPRTRARQFFRAQVGAAVVGALSSVLGVAVALLLRPGAHELAPFWVAAVGTILLAYPRGYELDDFDEPMNGSGD